MLTKVVLIGLLIVLFLWVLYERKCARDLLKEKLKREGYQLFTFNYTDEAPKEDFSGEHPEYQFREFYREHFSEFGRTFSDSSLYPGCPSTVCSNVQANSLTNINPISVDSSGFVMTLDMGRLPRQYHHRTTNKNSGVYTGLDEAMVWNGFDINHEKSSMPGHNPNVRGFAGECQTTTNNCVTDTATGKRTCREETVKIGGLSTDLNTLEHFMHKSTDLNDMKKGLGNYLDKLERVVFVRIGIESRNNWILTNTPNRNLLFAYGRFGSYTLGTLNTGPLGPRGYTRTTISASTINNSFGDPAWLTEKSIFIAFQLTNQDDYNVVSDLADAYIQSYDAKNIKNRVYDKFGKFVMMGTEENIFTSYGPLSQIGEENDAFDFRGSYGNLIRYERDHNNVWGVFSDQFVYAGNGFFDDIDPKEFERKYIWRLNYPGEFVLLADDILPPFIQNQNVINAPNVGTLKAIQNINGWPFQPDGYEYAKATGLNPRTASVFDQTPVLLKEPVSGVCSMTNVTDKNIAFPDFSDPNSSTYMTLAPAKGDSGKLFVSGPSKLTSLYSSELLTLEQHRNSVAYGGFVMNASTTNALFYNTGTLTTMINSCSINSGDDIRTIDVRKRLIDAGIAGSPDCGSQDYTLGTCVPSPFSRLYSAIGIINDRGSGQRHVNVIFFKLIEWNMIRWFAHSKGIPSLAQWENRLYEFFAYFFWICYNSSPVGAFLWNWETLYADLKAKYQDIYNRVVAPLTFKDHKIYQTLSTEISFIGINVGFNYGGYYQLEYFTNSSITRPMNQFLFDLFYCPATTTRVRALLNSYDAHDSKRSWLYAIYPEDRKRSRIYFDGYAAGPNARWASGAFSVADGRAVVVPRKFTRGTDAQMTMVNSFPRVYSVLKFYSSSNDVIFTLFWAHIPLYPGCGYPTMNYEITDKYGKPDFMNNNYSDNIFIFYLIGSESKWKQEIIDNGIDPICEEDFYIESVYHGSAMCLRSIDNASKRLNCGNYVLFAEDGLTATVAPKDTNSSETLGGEMGSFRIYCDEKGVFVYKRKISTTSEALQDYTVYSDYISVPGMKSCTGFSCWTPFREWNAVQSVFKSIRVEPPLLGDSLDSSKPPSAATPAQVTATDNYRNLAQKREMIQTYASLKHPTHPARVNTPVIKNINVLKAEGWRIVNVGGSGWVDPATTVLNPYKVQQKEDYNTAPYNVNYKSYETADAYGGAVGAMVSKWGLPTQTKYITRGEWIQLNFPVARQFSYYQIIVPEKYCKRSYTVATSENYKNTLPNNRSISDWTLLASNDETVNKRWVVLDIQKDLRFGDDDYNGVGASGNNFLINSTYFIGYLKDAMTYKYVRLVINGLHPNNFENIFSLDYFGAGGFPINNADDGTVVTTSITPFGFDNNYNYTDALKRPLVPVITAEGYSDDAYNNYSTGRNTLLTSAGGINIGGGDVVGPPLAMAPFVYYHKSAYLPNSNPSNMKVHDMDNRWSYTTNLANTLTKAENWKRGTVTKNIGIPTTDFNEIRRNTSATLRSYFTNLNSFVNITLGNYLFTWPELHMFMDTAAYSLMANDGRTEYYDTFISYTLFHYTKMVRDGAWRRSYNLSLDKFERYYEGSTITTYSYPCTIGDTNPPAGCFSFIGQPQVAGINNLRPDQEIPDERFTWPQPYQGGSYLVSSSVKCIAGQTCNSAGGNSTNVTPKYCFWIGDAATYTALINAGFPVQQEFNMNIMFDGDTNVYNDVPTQCLGKLTLNNLDMSSLNQFYPPPALYRQKGWKLIDDPNGENLWSGGVKLKNAMISENNQVVFTFPDVATALAYKEFDPNTGETTKVFSGCQGPSLVGTNVTISCPAGKLKATSGGAEESKPHIRWGKWNTSVCRDSFGDNQIEAPYRDLPSRCVGQSTCTITESDFGWSNPAPRDTTWDSVSGVTKISLTAVDNQHQFSSIAEVRVWTSPYSYVHPDSMTSTSPDWGNLWRITDYGDYATFFDPGHLNGRDITVDFYFNSAITVYKVDVVGGHIPGRLAGMFIQLFSNGTLLWESCPILRADGGGDYLYVENKPSYKFTSMWPGISRALFSSNSRVAYWWEFPITTYAYNPPDDAKITGAKTICINYENVAGGVRALQISEVKIYTAPQTVLPWTNVTISSSSTLGGFPDTNIKDGASAFWHSSDERNPGLMITLPDNTPIYKIVVGNRVDCCDNRITGVNVTIRNADGRVLFKSDKFQNKDPTKTDYLEGENGGYKYYGVYPAFGSTVYPADSESGIASPTAANLYQKRQWQVGFQCDYSDLSRVQRYKIPVGITSRQLHENYYNLMKQVNHQTVGVYDIRDYPETLKWYGESMKQEVLNSPQMKEELRKKEREHYKALKRGKVDDGDQLTTGREHYWDGDVCKPIGEVFETVANGVLEGIYNPIVSGINKIGLLKRGLGLTTQTVSIDWSCPIPGLGEAIGAIVNAAIAVGQAFVAAFNFVCELGEALVGAVINAGKYLFNRLGQVFTKERLGRFFRGFSNGLTGGYSLIGSLTDNFSWVGDAISNLGNLVVNLGNSVAQFFMNPSIDNFVAVIGNLLTLGIEAFIFVLEIGLSILTFFADLIGAFIGFIADIGNWIVNSVVGPIVEGLSKVADWITSWFTFW